VAPAAAATIRRIDAAPPFANYLHVTGIPALRVPGDPTIHLDASWARDLAHHTYLGERITVLCPIGEAGVVPPSHVPFTDPRFTFVALPDHAGTLQYVAGGRLFRAIARIWRETGRADLIFAGLVEHPIPLGWFAFPIARLRRVVAYTFLESAPWRLVPHVPASRKLRLRSAVATRLAHLMLRLLDFAAVTQPAYANLLPARTPRVLTPASWFLLDEMAPEASLDARAAAAASRAPGTPPVVLFAARLDEGKGVSVLLEALRLLDRDGAGPVTMRILGAGRLDAEVDACVASLTNVRVERIAPVRYGSAFFRLFDDVDCVVVPNLSDEQPRIVYDAASQGVAAIGADTTGVASVVDDGVTGRLVPLGSPSALADAIGALRSPDELRRCAAFVQDRFGAGSGRRGRRGRRFRAGRP
jgi:glycosyltransferase involved in cell wall biosynthesis